jgi:cell division protein FtsB
MNNSTHEEFEEVESPFLKSKPRASKLRSKKSHFNRPFAADPSIAPAVFDNSKRQNIGFQEQTVFEDFRENDFSDASIDYIDDGPEPERKNTRSPRKNSLVVKKKNSKTNLVTLPRVGWAVIVMLSLRLIFMDRGIWDFFSAEKNLENMRIEMKNLQNENRELVTEIGKIKFDKSYQKLLAKEHLGVIAANEFLVLFAGEDSDSVEQIKSSEKSL